MCMRADVAGLECGSATGRYTHVNGLRLLVQRHERRHYLHLMLGEVGLLHLLLLTLLLHRGGTTNGSTSLLPSVVGTLCDFHFLR